MTTMLVNGLREILAIIPYSFFVTRLTRLFENKLKVYLGSNVKIVGGAYLGPNVTIGDNVKIFRGVCITGGEAKTQIGANSFIGQGVFIENSEDVIIGNHVAIAPGVHIFTHDSVMHWLSHHILPMKTGKVHVGDNCYIGTGSFLLKGITIGDNSVVGANSVVTKDLPTSSVAIGSPANIFCKTSDYFKKSGFDLDAYLLPPPSPKTDSSI